MKRFLVLLLAGVSAFATAAAPAAMIFNVAPGTNTLAAARDAVRAWRAAGLQAAAVVIRLAPGEYTLTEPLTLTAGDGNETWEARSPERTLISGGERIGGWVADAAGLWHAHTRRHFEQLYVNGDRARRAGAPATGLFSIQQVQSVELPEGRARLTITAPAAAMAALPENSDDWSKVELLVFHKWDTSRYTVSACDRAAGTITVQGGRMTPWNPWTAQSRFLLDSDRTMLTQPGSWLLGAGGDLIYHPLPGQRMATTEVVAPVVEQFLRINGATAVHFSGLRFYHAAWTLPPAGDPPVQAAAALGAAIELDDCRQVTFENAEIRHTGNYAIWFRQGCRDCALRHCLLADLGGGGLRIGEMEMRDDPARQTGGIVADNNIIRGCGRVHPSAVGVWIGQSANNRITHNDISDTFYTGISVGWTWGYGRSFATNNFIGFNRIHRIGQGVLSDMGGLYTLGGSAGSAAVGNVIYDVRAREYGGWGIYPDEGSAGWRIQSNLVWNCTCVSPDRGGAFHQHYGGTNLLANNVFAFSSGPPMQATRAEDHLSFTLEHNLILSSNAAFFTGPWTRLQYASRSNCFIYAGASRPLFPTGNLASWQQAGHETRSILTNLDIHGDWPDITLPRASAAAAVGFVWFDPQAAGVQGEGAWKRRAGEREASLKFEE